MNIFPIGTISAASSSGSLNSVSYNMFEPNARASSSVKHNILVTPYQNQIKLTRKKAEPFIIIQYDYNNIFSREYKQIEHFIYNLGDALTSFYVVNWAEGITPSSVVDASGDWTAAITNTRLFSTITNQKANRAFLWDGLNWKEGAIASLSANTSITVDVDTSNFGALTLANANANSIVYPLYECYCTPDSLADFNTTVYLPESINLADDGGYMRSGSISFVSKYKV
uniref:Uncharacterized protein n=1 Tax=viral metagenome TaxID=1070528 RepID=A0A6M3KG61_9ZZZZ